jgi:stage II sporulation protein AA (anti-sigma F factor antagonist)
MATHGLFDVEREGDVVVVTPTADLREFEYQDIEAKADDLLDLVGKAEVKGVVLDFRRTDYYGSTALGFFLRIWKRISGHGGRLAFCNVSQHEREILTVTRLDGLWPICRNKDEALKLVRGQGGERA